MRGAQEVAQGLVSELKAVKKHPRCVRRRSARFARGGTVTKPVFLAESLESGEVVLAESVESGECEGLTELVGSVALESVVSVSFLKVGGP